MLFLLLACTTECPTADCRQAEILDLWPTDPAAATEHITALADPIEKVAVITTLTEGNPGQTTELCELLDGDARTRCRRLNHRPHLRIAPPPPVVSRRPAPGPETPNVLPDIPEPFAKTAAIPALGCSENAEPRSCRAQKAIEAAREGKARTAVGLCRGMPGEPVWQSECVFHAAEKLLAPGGLTRLTDAGEMCLSAGEFAANCLAHLTRRLSTEAPPASTPGTGPWTPILAAAETLDGYWREKDPVFGALTIDRLWADSLSRSYARTPQIVGNPLDLLPAAAHPHIHAAAALRLLGTAEDRTGSLADWQAQLTEGLAVRAERPLPPSEVPLDADFTDFWPEDAPGEETIPAAFGPGNTRRPMSADAETDQLLAILEAAARSQPPYPALLAEAAGHADETVRWNAKRLSAALEAAE
ncbi:MAG: hypothetical protein ACI8RZ_005775 [Myxococcota bacterium]|jgi:hypothetical protein